LGLMWTTVQLCVDDKVSIVSSKCSELNVVIPGKKEDDDPVEIPRVSEKAGTALPRRLVALSFPQPLPLHHPTLSQRSLARPALPTKTVGTAPDSASAS
jgi:hypothetical protein